MFVVIIERVTKVNTGARAAYEPRTANRKEITVSGPFSSHKLAQRAVVAALSSHTCHSARVYSRVQIERLVAKGYGANGNDKHAAYLDAQQCLDSAD